MHLVLDTLIQPSLITNVLSLSDSLVVFFKGNLLELYQIHENVLVLRHRHVLHDRVQDCCSLGDGKMMVTFREAKAAILGWSTEEGGVFVCESLHCWERNEFLSPGCQSYNNLICKVRSTPSNDMVVLSLFSEQAVMLDPVRQVSRVIRWDVLDERLRSCRILDFCFLPGFLGPTLAILASSPALTSASRLASVKDTCFVLILGMSSVDASTFTPLAHWKDLPYDLLRLWPLPQSHGLGILLLGSHHLILLDPPNTLHAMSLSVYAETVSALKTVFRNSSCESLRDAILVPLSDFKILIVTPSSGSSYVLSLERPAGRGLRGLKLERNEKLDRMIGVNDVLSLSENRVLIASRDGAYLLRIELAQKQEQSIDEEIYGSVVGTVKETTDLVQRLDHLSCFAASDMALDRQNGRISLCLDSSVASLLLKLPLRQAASFTVTGSQGIWFLSGAERPSYVLLGTGSATMLLSVNANAELDEVEESGFRLEVPTLFACSLYTGDVFVQVFSGGLRVIQNDKNLRMRDELLVETLREPRKVMTYFDKQLFLLAHDRTLSLITVTEDDVTLQKFKDDPTKFLTFGICGDLLATVEINGTLKLFNLQYSSVVFNCSLFGQVPALLSCNSNERCEFVAEICDILPVIWQEEVFLLVQRKDGTMFCYRQDGSMWPCVYTCFTSSDARLTRLTKEFILVSNKTSGSHLIFFGKRRFPRLHQLASHILSACALQDESQWLWVESSGRVSRGAIEPDSFLDHDVPVQVGPRIPHIRCTKIVLHKGSGIYAIAKAEQIPFVLPADEHSAMSDRQDWVAPEGTDIPTPMTLSFSIALISPLNLTIIDEWQDFRPYEHVTCLQSGYIRTGEGLKELLLVGTSYIKGEDRPSRGRLIIFDVTSVVPQPDRPETTHKFRLIRAVDVKGAVTATSILRGHILSTLGAKLFVHDWYDEEDRLEPVAFSDQHTSVSDAVSIKGFYATADMVAGIQFSCFRESPRQMYLLGRQSQATLHASVWSHVGLLHEGRQLQLIGGDMNIGLLGFFDYAPHRHETQGGDFLYDRGVMRTTSPISCIKSVIEVGGALVLLADGTIQVISPTNLDIVAFRQLHLLQSKLTCMAAFSFGLHPLRSKQHHLMLDHTLPTPRHILFMSSLQAFRHSTRLVALDNAGMVVTGETARHTHARHLGTQTKYIDADIEALRRRLDSLLK